MEQAGELARGGACGHYIIKQDDVTILMGRDSERAAQIAPSLAGGEPGLLRGGLDALQQPLVERDAGYLAECATNLFRLVEASPPVTPPVQGHWDDGFRRIALIEMVRQQASEQGCQQGLACIFQPGDQQGVRRLVIANNLQPLPGGRTALTAAAYPQAFFHIFRQGRSTQAASWMRLPQGLSAPTAQQGLGITGLMTEQTTPLPVTMTAEQRTCFDEQSL